MSATPTPSEFADKRAALISSDALLSESACCGLEERLMSLSEATKRWLDKTCERFADSQQYSKNEKAIQECLDAELIRKRRHYVEINGEVMDLVYSQKIFGHNAKVEPAGLPPTK